MGLLAQAQESEKSAFQRSALSLLTSSRFLSFTLIVAMSMRGVASKDGWMRVLRQDVAQTCTCQLDAAAWCSDGLTDLLSLYPGHCPATNC